MKIQNRSIGFCAVALFVGVSALSAQSESAAHSFARAGRHAGGASGEAITASGASAAGSAQVVSGIGVVPLWMAGKVVTGSGKVLAAAGDSTKGAGTSIERGAEKMWDFSTDENASRPPLARDRTRPSSAPVTAGRSADVSPAEAMRSS